MAQMYSNDNTIIDPTSYNIFLSWDEVILLSLNNFEIGSHGAIHQKMTELSAQELGEDLGGSKVALEERTNKSVNVLSYPYGRHSNIVITAAKSMGYTMAVSTMLGSNKFDDIEKDHFHIKRINPEEDKTLLDFKVRLYTNI